MGKKRSGNDKQSEASKQSFAEKFYKALDIPPDVLPGGFVIELRGREALSLSGSGSILLYTPKEIRLSLRSAILSVKGERLVCSSYSASEVTVTGHVCSITFEEACDG